MTKAAKIWYNSLVVIFLSLAISVLNANSLAIDVAEVENQEELISDFEINNDSAQFYQLQGGNNDTFSYFNQYVTVTKVAYQYFHQLTLLKNINIIIEDFTINSLDYYLKYCSLLVYF